MCDLSGAPADLWPPKDISLSIISMPTFYSDFDLPYPSWSNGCGESENELKDFFLSEREKPLACGDRKQREDSLSKGS